MIWAAKLLGFATGPLGKVVGKAILVLGAAAVLWWFAQQLKTLGELSSQVEYQTQLIGKLGAQNDALRSKIDALGLLYAERERRMRKIEASFSDLRAENKEILDACTDAPLPGLFIEQLRIGADLAAGGLPDGTALSVGTDAPP